MRRKTKDKNLFTEEYVKEHRRFPIFYTVVLCFLVIAQIALLLVALLYHPIPADEIEKYHVTVRPREDGTLDITYHIRWRVIGGDEALTWVAIGLANGNWTYYPDMLSNNIAKIAEYDSGEVVYADLTFKEAYRVGDVIDFSFTINQKDMLCLDIRGRYFYEFIPCWFNKINVEDYQFMWYVGAQTPHSNADTSDGEWLIWRGEMPRGSYVPMRVNYGSDAFFGADTVNYQAFDDEGVYDELQSDKRTITILCILVIIMLAFFELFIIDSYVSYVRGRGFLVGHGYYVHTYGRRNPAHVRAGRAHRARGGGFSGGGCACACACACAGGGRAGCSQKDTYYKQHPPVR